MECDRILAILRAHQAEFHAAGLLHLRLFGSVARGDNTPDSDIDLLADLDPEARLSLMALARYRNSLADLLEADVHLSNSDAMYPQIRERVMPETVLAF